MRIIPAIDLRDGKCVRLFKGDFEQTTVYQGDPIDIAKEYEDKGIQYLHLVDLDGALEGSPKHLKLLEKICYKTSLKVDFSGGIRNEGNIRSSFSAGANQVCLGTVAIKEREIAKEWFKIFSPEKIVLALDIKDEKVSVSGWKEDSKIFFQDIIQEYLEAGLLYVMSTDISKDGTLTGSNHDLYKKIKDTFVNLKVIASGGVNSVDDVEKLREIGVDGVIIGKAIYEKKITWNAEFYSAIARSRDI